MSKMSQVVKDITLGEIRHLLQNNTINQLIDFIDEIQSEKLKSVILEYIDDCVQNGLSLTHQQSTRISRHRKISDRSFFGNCLQSELFREAVNVHEDDVIDLCTPPDPKIPHIDHEVIDLCTQDEPNIIPSIDEVIDLNTQDESNINPSIDEVIDLCTQGVPPVHERVSVILHTSNLPNVVSSILKNIIVVWI